MDVKTIRNAILCPGRNLWKRNVQNAAVIWWKKEIKKCVRMLIADLLPLNRADLMK